MIDFHLFRTKVHKGPQLTLFEPDEKPSKILFDLINSKPSAELRKGYMWHIGNVARIQRGGLYFALGRTTSSTVERYDSGKGDFLEEEFETAPYTHVLIDLTFQVAAIAKKTRLMPTVNGIAHQLEKLINGSIENINKSIRVEISAINDPYDFIHHIREAYSVMRFSLEFGLPNPWDVEKDFQKPMEKLLEESDGDKGKTSVSGTDLNRETLEKLTRSAAATGNDAQAIIKMTAEAKRTFKRLKGNPATLHQECMDEPKDKAALLAAVRNLYKNLRYRNGDFVD
jgi:hypothetical protein